MITNEQILQIAREHLEEFPDDFNATREQLIAFAREIYDEGYWDFFYNEFQRH